MIRWLQRLLMGRHHRAELDKLERYRVYVREYAKWFSHAPDISHVLVNLKGTVEGEQFYGRLGHDGVGEYELQWAQDTGDLRQQVDTARNTAMKKAMEKRGWQPAADLSRAFLSDKQIHVGRYSGSRYGNREHKSRNHLPHSHASL